MGRAVIGCLASCGMGGRQACLARLLTSHLASDHLPAHPAFSLAGFLLGPGQNFLLSTQIGSGLVVFLPTADCCMGWVQRRGLSWVLGLAGVVQSGRWEMEWCPSEAGKGRLVERNHYACLPGSMRWASKASYPSFKEAWSSCSLKKNSYEGMANDRFT